MNKEKIIAKNNRRIEESKKMIAEGAATSESLQQGIKMAEKQNAELRKTGKLWSGQELYSWLQQSDNL